MTEGQGANRKNVVDELEDGFLGTAVASSLLFFALDGYNRINDLPDDKFVSDGLYYYHAFLVFMILFRFIRRGLRGDYNQK